MRNLERVSQIGDSGCLSGRTRFRREPLPTGSLSRDRRRERPERCDRSLRTGRQTIRALEKLGFDQVSQRGSHMKLRNEAGRTTIVPLHDELTRGTLRSVLRQAGIKLEDFRDAQ